MGVRIYGRNYRNQYRNELTDWLLGNVGDWQRLELGFRVACEVSFLQTNPLIFEGSNKWILGNGKMWGDYGFDIGDTIVMSFKITVYDSDGNPIGTFPATWSRTITNIWGDNLEYSGGTNPNDYQMFPIEKGNLSVFDVMCYADKRPQGALITYGHTTNEDSDSMNINSFIDGTKSVIKLLGMHTVAVNSWQLGEKIGFQSGMSIGNISWTYWGKIGTHSYNYVANIEYMISSFYEDTSNLETRTPPSTVFNANSITDNFDIVCMPEWNNPNCRIQNDMNETKRLGNTGWFDENFNGFDDPFTVNSVNYYDVTTGAIQDSLSYSSQTRVVAEITGINNLINGVSKFGFGFILINDLDERYKENKDSFHENMSVNTGDFNYPVYPASNTVDFATRLGFHKGDGIKVDVRNVRFQIIGTTTVRFEAIIMPTPSMTAFFETLDPQDRRFAIWVSLADSSKVTNFSDRVSKLLDFNEMKKFLPPLGEWENMSTDMIEHAQDPYASDIDCPDVFFVEDDIFARTLFGLNINEEIPSSLIVGIEAVNSVTLQSVTLESQTINLTLFPNDSNGIPQFDVDETRGFHYISGNDKNLLILERYPPLDANPTYVYALGFGFKIRWEDWLQRLGFPSDFFDSSEQNNNFNNDWFTKQLGNWSINHVVYMVTSEGAYKNLTPIIIKDYDSNTDIVKNWSYFRDSDSAPMTVSIDPISGLPLGAILQGEKTRIQVDFVKTSGAYQSPITDYYGKIMLLPSTGNHKQHRQLSTIVGSEPSNPLEPITGETHCKIELISPNVIRLTCRVDPTKMTEEFLYRVSARLGCLIK